MNDPHVVALLYRIEHGRSVDYGKAKPLDHEEASFRVKIENEQVRFEFKEHLATEDDARKAIEDYIRVWEFDAGLRMGPNSFKLKFDRAQIEDRNPTPGVVDVSFHFRAGLPKVTVTATVSPPCYPPPPSALKLTPNVRTMYERYMGYLQGREPLATMAYFCLTVLQGPKRKRYAARRYATNFEVLNKIGYLSSERGGERARRAQGKDNDLTGQDRRFLKEAIKAVIRRAAEKAHAPDRDLPEISLLDLPPG